MTFEKIKQHIGPEGTCAEMLRQKLKCTWRTANKLLEQFDEEGRLIFVRYRKRVCRYFLTKQDASAFKYVPQNRPTGPKKARVIAVPAPAVDTPWRADHSKPAPVKFGKADGPVQIKYPPGFKPTICPGFKERFAVNEPVIGGFASLGVGRYLESEEEWRRRFGRAA